MSQELRKEQKKKKENQEKEEEEEQEEKLEAKFVRAMCCWSQQAIRLKVGTHLKRWWY